MSAFHGPGLVHTECLDDVDFDLVGRITVAGEDRSAQIAAINGSSKTAVKLACDWICSAKPENVGFALAAAMAANSVSAQRSVANFIDRNRHRYSDELQKQAWRILQGR